MKYSLSDLFYQCAYTVIYEQVGHDVNYAFEENEDGTLVIYFQGSSSTTDWVRNFLFGKRPYKDMAIPYDVHRGFLAAWKEVEDTIINKILELGADGINYKWNDIIVVGYSHGGALAGLCHECVWYHRPDLRHEHLHGYGFEAPRFFAAWHVKKVLAQRWEHFLVIRTNNDLVTHCPPVLFRYTHVGHILKIKGDVSLVEKRLPRCLKSHYPEVVYDALLKFENNI